MISENALTDSALQELKSQTLGMMYAHYQDYVNLHQFRLDPKHTICSLWDSLEAIKTTPNTEKPSYMSTHWIQKTESLLDGLFHLCTLHAAFQSFESLLSSGEMVGASASLSEMVSTLDKLKTNGGGWTPPEDLMEVLEDQLHIIKASFQYTLEDLLNSALVFHGVSLGNMSSQRVFIVHQKILATQVKQYYDNPVPLTDLFVALENGGALKDKVSHYTQLFHSGFFSPLVQSSKVLMDVQKSGKLQATVTLTVPSSSNPTFSFQELDSIYDNVLKIGEFIFDQFFDSCMDDENPMKSFARCLTQQLLQVLLKEGILPRLPTDVTDIEDFVNMALKVKNVEAQLSDWGLLDSASHVSISEWIYQSRSVFIKKQSTEFLSMAKDILLCDDPSLVQVSSSTERSLINGKTKSLDQDIAAVKNKQGLEVSETPIQLAPCHISVKVQTLIELLYQKLISLAQDGQEKDSEIAIEVYFLARDTLDLFRALMMSQFSNISQPSFKDALVFYNDCQYICHHLITLSRQFQEVLPDPLRQSATFVDMNFLFRALGEEKLTALWDIKNDGLMRCLESMPSWESIEVSELAFVQAGKIVEQVIYELTQASRDCRSVLSEDMFGKTLGALVDTVLFRWNSLAPSQCGAKYSFLHHRLASSIESLFQLTQGHGRLKTVKKLALGPYISQWTAFTKTVT